MVFLLLFTIVVTPLFALRTQLGTIPTNFLMLWVIAVGATFIITLFIKKQVPAFFQFIQSINKKLFWAILLFFLAGTISLVVGGLNQKNIGQFFVLFAEPAAILLMSGYTFQQKPQAKQYVYSLLYFFTAAAGVYAIIQYFTLHGLPIQYWGNALEPKRAISFFGHPDFYALYMAPILAFLLPHLSQGISQNKKNSTLWGLAVLWLLGATGILLSLSRAGWLGLGLVSSIYLFFAGSATIKKIAFALLLVGAFTIGYFPNLRYRLITPFYGEKSSNSRVTLWKDGLRGISRAPILGLGINGFANNWTVLNTDSSLDSHNFPHNIFLDIWVDMGLLGLASFIWICWLYIYNGFKSQPKNIIALSITLFLITLLVQGQFDNPYFRNDLAIIFWIILSLCL